jgi:6-phosphogluconolactonase
MENFKVISFPNDRTLAQAAAQAWLEAIASQRHQPHCVALSGGRIAKSFFSAVATAAITGAGGLHHVHFFWADERCVPPDDAESNFRTARELLLTPLGIEEKKIHRIRGEEKAEFAVAEAEGELCRVAPLNADGQPVLDLILLGMGEDGHVASLFPGEPEAVMASKKVYRAVTASKPPPRRITLGYAAIATAKEVWVLASGTGKESALRESLRLDGRTPLARVLRSRQNAKIFTDIRVG